MSGGNLVWICLVPVPIVALSLLAAPPEPRLERVFMTDVHDGAELWSRLMLLGWYLFWRGVPMACAVLFVFVDVLYGACRAEPGEHT